MRSILLEAVAQLQGGSVVSERNEHGTARVKIVLNKRQLSELMVLMGRHRGSNAHKIAAAASSSPSASLTLEQRLPAMQRRRRSRSETTKGSRRGPWRPALQSIPEEL